MFNKKYIINLFFKFLFKNRNNISEYYFKKVNKTANSKIKVLNINYIDLVKYSAEISIILINSPAFILKIITNITKEIIKSVFYPYTLQSNDYSILVGISNLPFNENISSIKVLHINTLIRFKCILLANTSISIKDSSYYYICNNCYLSVNITFRIKVMKLSTTKTCLICRSKLTNFVILENKISSIYKRGIIQSIQESKYFNKLPNLRSISIHKSLINDKYFIGNILDMTGIPKCNINMSKLFEKRIIVRELYISINYIKNKKIIRKMNKKSIINIQILSNKSIFHFYFITFFFKTNFIHHIKVFLILTFFSNKKNYNISNINKNINTIIIKKKNYDDFLFLTELRNKCYIILSIINLNQKMLYLERKRVIRNVLDKKDIKNNFLDFVIDNVILIKNYNLFLNSKMNYNLFLTELKKSIETINNIHSHFIIYLDQKYISYLSEIQKLMDKSNITNTFTIISIEYNKKNLKKNIYTIYNYFKIDYFKIEFKEKEYVNNIYFFDKVLSNYLSFSKKIDYCVFHKKDINIIYKMYLKLKKIGRKEKKEVVKIDEL